MWKTSLLLIELVRLYSSTEVACIVTWKIISDAHFGIRLNDGVKASEFWKLFSSSSMRQEASKDACKPSLSHQKLCSLNS